jgi:1-acyl-sn-glycerol-3-phosphate acyltransferase
VHLYKTQPYFVLALAPEGTRKKVDKWKTGFYKIAHKANVPIVMAGLDYGSKTVFFSAPFTPCGDLKLDAAHINSFYAPLRGKTRNTAPVMLD